ncbi:MAG: serine/threonine protein kinase [Pseudomonadota bacterium]
MAGPAQAKLPPGTRFQNATGARQGVIDAFLGQGGQGSVYAVSLEGGSFALKWYHDSYTQIDTGLRQRLTHAVHRGAPNSSFLWPLELVEIDGQQSFGYVMPVRGSEYRGMRDLIARPPERVELTLAQRFMICCKLADSFLQLHAQGLCYQDINFGNVFFNPATLDVLICDNDNVNVEGADASIYGTRKFMAPEVVRRETLPNTKTDLFSMSVLFFYVVMGWHPLDGKREADYAILNAEAEMSLYGTEPVFLFDPKNDANGPVTGMHDPLVTRWKGLPSDVRALFTRAFTAGLNDPSARVLERQWRQTFMRAVHALFPCPSCGADQALEAGSDAATFPAACTACGAPLPAPLYLDCRRGPFALRDSHGLPTHMLTSSDPNFKSLVGFVEAHPKKPDMLGLRNLSDDSWKVQLPDRDPGLLPPGKAIGLFDGSVIHTSQATCAVRTARPKETAT